MYVVLYVVLMILIFGLFYAFVTFLDFILRSIFCKRYGHDCSKCKNWFCLEDECDEDDD